MTIQIQDKHLAFMHEAREAFLENDVLDTYRNEEDFDLIALRMGYDRDCILIYELGQGIANFVQQMKPSPRPRKEVMKFASYMENQLAVNEHKGHWHREHQEFLFREMARNVSKLYEALNTDKDKAEVTIRAANIANFAMMIADNEGDSI